MANPYDTGVDPNKVFRGLFDAGRSLAGNAVMHPLAVLGGLARFSEPGADVAYAQGTQDEIMQRAQERFAPQTFEGEMTLAALDKIMGTPMRFLETVAPKQVEQARGLADWAGEQLGETGQYALGVAPTLLGGAAAGYGAAARAANLDRTKALESLPYNVEKDPDGRTRIVPKPAQQVAEELARTFEEAKQGVGGVRSSVDKQAAIARAFELGAKGSPQYKDAVFKAWKEHAPEMMGLHDVRNYDELVKRSYEALGNEVDQQFRGLPIATTFHGGELEYPSSNAMMQDVRENKNLNVFQGGDPHQFLKKVDPLTGLSQNDKFRAVHDNMHEVTNTGFGPLGEERAWYGHSKTLSPLAQIALASETRGQNSLVNYSPLNAEVHRDIIKTKEALMSDPNNPELQARLKELNTQRQYAPQVGVALPPEMLDPNFSGQMPAYVPNEPDAPATMWGLHYGNKDVPFSDPNKYGSGKRGEERNRLANDWKKPRTFFYTDETVGENGLGPYRRHAMLDKVYPADEDPQKLKLLADTLAYSPLYSQINPGNRMAPVAANNLETLARAYGYEGLSYPDFYQGSGAAAMFTPQRLVKPR
jgi:hypothetical protein